MLSGEMLKVLPNGFTQKLRKLRIFQLVKPETAKQHELTRSD